MWCQNCGYLPYCTIILRPGLLHEAMHKSRHWLRALLEGVSLTLPLKSKVTSTMVGPRCISPTAKDYKNDTSGPHSAALALTATIAMDRQRRFFPLSVWVDSGLGRWLYFYGYDNILFLPSWMCHTTQGGQWKSPLGPVGHIW